MVTRYHHLKGVVMDTVDLKREQLVHLILGINEYVQAKTETTPNIGKPREPTTELTL